MFVGHGRCKNAERTAADEAHYQTVMRGQHARDLLHPRRHLMTERVEAPVGTLGEIFVTISPQSEQSVVPFVREVVGLNEQERGQS